MLVLIVEVSVPVIGRARAYSLMRSTLFRQAAEQKLELPRRVFSRDDARAVDIAVFNPGFPDEQ